MWPNQIFKNDRYLRICSALDPFHTIIILISITQISTVQTDCPRICSVCISTTLICESGGFLEFPTKYLSTTENITLIGHHFTNNILSSANLTGLHYLKLRYLAIRSSSIQEIFSKTFSQLNFLHTLDLSENQILKVHNFAFEGLNIDTLKLNEIGKLKLFSNSFTGLRVRVLSIKNSRLGVLDYDVFYKIDHSTFQNFQISNNNFRTIDQRFEGIFNKLMFIDLKGNPFVCNCSLLWLKRLSMILLKEMFEIIFPKCVSPPSLRNRKLPEIIESEFKCFPPKISEIGINFLTLFVAELVCHVDTTVTRNNPTDITWIVSTNKIPKKQLKSKDIGYLRVQRSELKDVEYQCLAENKIGNSSIVIFLEWPSNIKMFKSNQTLQVDYAPPIDSFPWSTSFYFKRRYTLVELIVAVITSFITTILLFLITYKLCVQSPSCPKFSKKAHHVDHHKVLSQSKVLVSRYPPTKGNYGNDNGLHSIDSNSQTYDCISISNAVYPHTMIGHASNTLPGQFLDYKTHERLYTTTLDQ